MEQYDNNEKVDQRGLEEVLSFCIEERHDATGLSYKTSEFYLEFYLSLARIIHW